MIQKIKDLMTIKEQIDVIKNNLNYTTNSMNDLKTEIGTLKQQINENISSINDKNNEFFKNFDENLNLIKNTKQNFEKELFDFKLLKSQMQKRIVEKFEEELDKELKIQMETLKIDAGSYNELKENIAKITDKVNNLSEEINKFTAISSSIKKEDFELTRFANQLREADKEKLELMEKINTLERLVSKMRRQEFITR
jgi:chromosome segregation ATPase|tara:strand:- start:8231 stop:8821 length:591 start_codon:yes stop_codon:yes gene_type:complete